jgi:hypothetical protein
MTAAMRMEKPLRPGKAAFAGPQITKPAQGRWHH